MGVPAQVFRRDGEGMGRRVERVSLRRLRLGDGDRSKGDACELQRSILVGRTYRGKSRLGFRHQLVFGSLERCPGLRRSVGRRILLDDGEAERPGLILKGHLGAALPCRELDALVVEEVACRRFRLDCVILRVGCERHLGAAVLIGFDRCDLGPIVAAEYVVPRALRRVGGIVRGEFDLGGDLGEANGHPLFDGHKVLVVEGLVRSERGLIFPQDGATLLDASPARLLVGEPFLVELPSSFLRLGVSCVLPPLEVTLVAVVGSLIGGGVREYVFALVRDGKPCGVGRRCLRPCLVESVYRGDGLTIVAVVEHVIELRDSKRPVSRERLADFGRDKPALGAVGDGGGRAVDADEAARGSNRVRVDHQFAYRQTPFRPDRRKRCRSQCDCTGNCRYERVRPTCSPWCR